MKPVPRDRFPKETVGSVFVGLRKILLSHGPEQADLSWDITILEIFVGEETLSFLQSSLFVW